jgi:hypothetical protein
VGPKKWFLIVFCIAIVFPVIIGGCNSLGIESLGNGKNTPTAIIKVYDRDGNIVK